VTFNLTGATTVTGSNWVYAEIPDADLPDSTCPEYVTYEAEDGEAKIDLNRDCSGKLGLPRLVSGSGSLSGSISWRCIDPK
jgi:hypothetical protein